MEPLTLILKTGISSRMSLIPTMREALLLPSSLAAVTAVCTAEAAIFVILIELVFVARIASGRISAASS
jgi:hypothetical protein